MFYLRTGVAASELLRMETVQRSSESLSKSPGAALGAGIAIIPQVFQQQTPTPSQAMVLCPKCNFQNPQSAKFCSNCGSPLQAGFNCPKCGTLNPVGAKFCVNCGNSLQSTIKCPKCGSEVQAGSRFCPNCGAKLRE